jgi:hypothetical protein
VRAFSGAAPGFAAETDWLLEEGGFELVVPPLVEMREASLYFDPHELS